MKGTTYEIDVIGYRKGNGRLVIFECRDYAKKLNQEAVRGFAYRIQVTGAESGYIVTPVGLQSGAKLVADYERINVIRIPRGASPDNYVIQLMHGFLAKVTEKMPFQDEIKVEVVRAADRASGPDRQ